MTKLGHDLPLFFANDVQSHHLLSKHEAAKHIRPTMLLAKINDGLHDVFLQGAFKDDVSVRSNDHQALHEDARLRFGPQARDGVGDPAASRGLAGGDYQLQGIILSGKGLKGRGSRKYGGFL